jgi:hypothetical protein
VKSIPIQSLGGTTSLTLYFRVPAETQFTGLVLATGKEDRLVNTLRVTSPKKEE